MFPTRDPYRRLHSRRRRTSKHLGMALLATLLVGCAAAAALIQETQDEPSADPIVAQLTAQDAVANAMFVAVPELAPVAAAQLPSVPEPAAKPDRWTPGEAGSFAGTLRRNESFSTSLARKGVPQSSMHSAVASLGQSIDFRRSKPGDPWQIDLDANGGVTRLRYATSPVNVWESRLSESGKYESKQIDVATETKLEVVSGTVNASLWQAFQESGAGGALAVELANIFAYTIDFVTETQRGDRFFLAFESEWLDGKRLSIGKIVAARYVGAAGDHQAFLWEGAYYDETGESVERQFLRSPLASVRITSSFGRRFHPVLGKMKMHAGVDYGAPTGTPVQSVADGTVTWAGWKGANGKLVAIRHAAGFTTYYAHLSKIGKGLRPGSKVKKKQLIGKVGNTGRSTGPHLHFGMKQHGKYVNPLKVDFERGAPLGKKDRKMFLAETASLKSKLQ